MDIKVQNIETQRTCYRIEERYVLDGTVVQAWHLGYADVDEAWLWLQGYCKSFPNRFTPHSPRRLVLVAVVTSAFDAFRQRVEAHRTAGHPGGVGGCKACPTPATARRQIGARS